MWNALKRYVRTQDEQGRARFARFASDAERTTATVSSVGIGAATGFALLSFLYFALYAILAIMYAKDLTDPKLWVRIYYISLIFGLVKGSAIGGIAGWTLALKWQGKRHKAALTALIGGIVIITLLGLFQSQYYDPSLPLEPFIGWALILFSPAYFIAACLTAWGVSLLSKE